MLFDQQLNRLGDAIAKLDREVRNFIQEGAELRSTQDEISKRLDRTESETRRIESDTRSAIQRVHERIDAVEHIEAEQEGQHKILSRIVWLFAIPLLGFGVWLTQSVQSLEVNVEGLRNAIEYQLRE